MRQNNQAIKELIRFQLSDPFRFTADELENQFMLNMSLFLVNSLHLGNREANSC